MTGKNGRYMLISADTHAGPPVKELKQYFEEKHWQAFDEYVEEREAQKAVVRAASAQTMTGGPSMPEERMKAWMAHESLQPGGHPGLSEPARRIRDLDADGVVGEVIFPDFPHIVSNEPPFGTVTGGRKLGGGINQRSRELYDPELVWAGARAYNRWLADFCSVEPARRAGMAIMPFFDIDAAVSEVRWAHNAGLRGGILLPGMTPELPGYNDASYEPIWSVCEDLGMPLNTHSGNEVPDYGTGPDATLLLGTEVMFFSHRPLWWLMWGGVFERHPSLNLVFTEQMADWVPSTLSDLEEKIGGQRRQMPGLTFSLSPREYWLRQCFVGATFMSPAEAKMRDEIGIDTIMWGSDYPHIEGSWPKTKESLRYAYAGIPRDDVQRMVGANAARVYHFDVETLSTIVQRIGPTEDELAEPLAQVPKDYIGAAFR